ncbi:YoaK family protein [Albibacterium indicum]|uniref:YoaK family protein n=1 Tax=Albibacterium indicum TaxID=2292082 RepID=UPI000E4A315B|nr:YoaK family protein [Pedobacter indicus]
MFRHFGERRNLSHNLQLATLLSFVAGVVNINGVFYIKTLTTNVTGHFAFFAEEFVLSNYRLAAIYGAYVASFLLGSFVSGFLMQLIARRKKRMSPVLLPILLEMLVITLVWYYSYTTEWPVEKIHIVAASLLFAMSVQNGLVTLVSNSIVRTTHLTGMFTDLGIELAQLFFYRKPTDRKKLKQSIFLRLAIIVFFFLGCIIGGFLYKFVSFHALLLAVGILGYALFYDALKYQFYFLKRRFMSGI